MPKSRSQSPRTSGPSRPRFAVLVVVAAVALAGCSASAAKTVPRPHTNAQLLVLSPTANEVTGPTLVIRFQVKGATVSPPNKLVIVPNEGHIHVSVDGKLVVMSYGVTTTLHNLTPGLHLLQAEFVANDHLPFANRVINDVQFTVKA